MSRGWKGSRAFGAGIVPPWSWVSYVGAVTSALRARGVECDYTSVAGMSGYAFIVNIGSGLCPDGVVAFDWKMLEEGTSALGVATEIVTVECEPDLPERPGLLAELFERVREEIDRGSPCVVWGATSAPEFAVVYGYEGDSYLVRSVRSVGGPRGAEPGRAMGPAESPEPAVRFDALQAPGRLGVVLFGEEQPAERHRVEGRAIVRAGQLLAGQHACFEPGHIHGWQGFEAWAGHLTSGDWDGIGASYTLNCLLELQLAAAGFCRRLAHAGIGGEERLSAASGSFARSVDRLQALREFFPFPGGDTRLGPATLQGAVRSLRACADENRQALAALQDAAALVQ